MEGQDRTRELHAEELQDDPIARAFREKEDYSTPERAMTSLMIMPRSDPRRLPMWLDAVAQFPADDPRFMLLLELQNAGLVVRLTGGRETQARQTSQSVYDEELVTELTRLMADGHPEHERMQRVIDAMKAKPVDK